MASSPGCCLDSARAPIFSKIRRRDSLHNRTQTNFVQVVARYKAYAAAHRDHTFITTIEGIASKKRTAQLTGLFKFLGETLTPQLRRVAKAQLVLQDWAEQTHTRRFQDGTTPRFAFSTAAETLAEERVLEKKGRRKRIGAPPVAETDVSRTK